ncbi:hypothetical protein GIB67_000799 [Kingdonia uniflora]|uniref:UspA domain-containing protein n=1 Tax=Kingdonia uniflora TaxID=39325 RepID=A0A7J7NZX7_9MAGN|nr:hypothetical protein GIB67_000799 [Kingdonia uniflora]
MPSSNSFLRQISGRESWNSASKRWGNKSNTYGDGVGEYYEKNMNMYGGFGGCEHESDNGLVMRKRVMVVVDQFSSAKHAMIWALTHVTNKGDLLTLLHIIPPDVCDSESTSPSLANSLGSLCKACKPEVEIEALLIRGPKLATVMSQVKKLEVSVLVLGQKKPSSSLFSCFCGGNKYDFVEQCINNAECLTLGVKKQSRGMGGYLISSRWQKNFWLLA